MKKYQKVLLIIGTIIAIIFILYGIPQIALYIKGITGIDFRIMLYLLVVFGLYLIGRVRGGSEYSKLNKELRALDRELIQNHNTEYYIVQNKRLYKETDDKKYRAIIMTNIAMAYYQEGQYEKSNNVIEKIDPENLNENQQAQVYNQQFLNYVNLRQLNNAAAIYAANETLFQKFEEDKEYRNHFLVSRLSYELADAGKDKEKIAKIREEFDTIEIPQKSYAKAYQYRLLEGKLMIAEGNGKEGKDNLRLLQKEYLMPGMRREITRALKY
jgi:hypothetical protein